VSTIATPPANSANEAADQIRLAAFIRHNIEPITGEWIAFAQTRTPASEGMTKLALRDHIEEILNFIADDLESPQTKGEQVAKSHGLGPNSQVDRSAAEVHAALRLSDGFDIDQMVSEYRALRASVVKQWTSRQRQLAPTDLDDLTRFNEAIDQAMAESVAHYTRSIEHSRNLFLGVLGHDLRNPIGAASMTAQMMLKRGDLSEKQTTLASQVVSTTKRAIEIVNALLDITRSAFGNEIPIVKAPMDMGELARALVGEMRAISHGRAIDLEVIGDTKGHWDEARIGQVFSNLIGNALQHSTGGSPVQVAVASQGPTVLVTVRNGGDPIPPEKLRKIFDDADPGHSSGPEAAASTHLGLGLFIARKIAEAHGGSVGVASSDEAGTIFSVVLPRS
jgi:signal transduction histidine kinase